MLKVNKFRLNHGALKKGNRYRITETTSPCLSWGIMSDHQNSEQTAFRLRVWNSQAELWDTGWVETNDQQVIYAGSPLPTEKRICFSVAVRDNHGETSDAAEDYFFLSSLCNHSLSWIAPQEDEPNKALYFRKVFRPGGEVKHATLYISGLGYHHLTLNGNSLDDAVLDPAFSDYTKTVYYIMVPELEQNILLPCVWSMQRSS